VQIRHQAPGAEVHAFDFSARSLEFARRKIEALGGEPVTGCHAPFAEDRIAFSRLTGIDVAR